MAAFGKDGPDVLAMGQQFWNAWTDLAQGVAQGKAPDWSDPMQAFSKAAGPLGGEAAHAVDALAEQGQRYMAFLQSAASRLGMQDPMQAPDLAQLWRHNMAEGNPVLDALRATVSEGARGFEQLAQDVRPMLEQARSEWMKSLSTPTFGYSREQQERMQALLRAQGEHEAATAAYHALLARAGQRGMEYFEEKLAERSEPGRQIESARALYDLWVDAAEEAYAQIAMSPEFRAAYGEMVNAQMRLKARVQDEIGRHAASMGLPTRTELDGTHEKIRDLRRELRALRQQLDALTPVAPVGAAPPKPKAAASAAARKPNKAKPAAARVVKRASAAAAGPVAKTRAKPKVQAKPLSKSKPKAKPTGRKRAAGFAEMLAANRAALGKTKRTGKKGGA